LAAEQATRGKTLYLECYARGPQGFDSGFPFELPTRQDCYACFSEGWAAWEKGHTGDLYTGLPSLEFVNAMGDELSKCGFSVGPLTGKDGHLILG